MTDQNSSSSRSNSAIMGRSVERGVKVDSLAAAGPRGPGSARSVDNPVVALITSRLSNAQGGARLANNQENIPLGDSPPLDMILARLSEQKDVLAQQSEALKFTDGKAPSRGLEHSSSSASVPVTPATDIFPSAGPSTRPASTSVNRADSGEEVLQLKMKLAEAQAKLSRLEDRSDSQGFREMGPAQSQSQSHAQMPVLVHEGIWANDESFSDTGDTLATIPPNRAPSSVMFNGNLRAPIHGIGIPPPSSESSNGSSWFGPRNSFNQTFVDAGNPYHPADGYRSSGRLSPDSDIFPRPAAGRRGVQFNGRFASPGPINGSFGPGPYNQPIVQPIGQPIGGYDMVPSQHAGGASLVPGPQGMGMGVYPGYQPPATALSPHATEFTSGTGWKNEAVATEGQTYLPTTEPLNYRRLLDRNVNCNWKYIVDKIVCNNDQQASIFLQQKLKVGTPEQKYDIVEAIVSQAYPLMVNRFGNFLVQRCFEHGTPEQVIKIAEAIRGNTLNLSMDPFGCHVVQKAFDSVPEEYKAIMVHELLRRIPETVIHRYACHVWQKLFELRWTDSPPQIMKYVNEALRGMWHEVALGETGSLVVQNIFENCLEEDKRPCIEEVLANIDIVAHGQFGNWCIQHVCEHGAPPDRSRAIDHVIRYAAEYSTDQFASKVVEKCLKIGGPEFLGRYLDRVCEGRPDRPRIPLIDIASDQYGNYLIQYILTHASPQHRDVVAAHIRKHMVSLRGSKFGSRVGMLCTNPASATRPGPAMGPGMGAGRMHPGSRYAGPGYR